MDLVAAALAARTEEQLAEVPAALTTCDECEEPGRRPVALGMCARCYVRWRRHLEPHRFRRRRRVGVVTISGAAGPEQRR